MHSVIDLEAEDNAAAIASVNSAMLFGAMKDIVRTQGMDELKRMIDENYDVLEADIH